jgi:predicted nucleotidyltransferase
MNLLDQHRTEMETLCNKYKVKELYAFGSVLENTRFNVNSDVDLLVKFKDEIPVEQYADLYFGFVEELEKILGRHVDLMLLKPIRNRFLMANIEATKQLAYAA